MIYQRTDETAPLFTLCVSMVRKRMSGFWSSKRQIIIKLVLFIIRDLTLLKLEGQILNLTTEYTASKDP